MSGVDPIILQIQAETREINQRLDALDRKVDKTQKSFDEAGKSGTRAFDRTGKASDKTKNKIDRQEKSVNKLESGYKTLERRIIAAFAIERITTFTIEATRLAGELQGVETAFNRISKPGLLRDLRDATRGTVSDLELMKQAVRADNFQIPLESMASLFEFARRRAKETGEEVDFLVNSIISGIGRKSPLILDNLGISAVRLRKELKGVGVESAGVGEIAEVVGAIASEEMRKMGDEVITTKDRTDALNASFENMQAAIGEALIPAVEDLLDVFTSLEMRMDSVGELGFWRTLFGGYDPQQIANVKDLNRTIDDILISAEQQLNQVADSGIEEVWQDITKQVTEQVVETEKLASLDEELQQRLLERLDGELSAIRLKREQNMLTDEERENQESLNTSTEERIGIIKRLKDEIKALGDALPDAQSQGQINSILDQRNQKEIELNAILNQRKNILEFENEEDQELALPTFPENPFGMLSDEAKKLRAQTEEEIDELYERILEEKIAFDQADIQAEQDKADQIAAIYQQRTEAVAGFFGALTQLMQASGKNAKELATFQAFLNFYLAISDALAQPLDPITKAIYVATITAQAAAQISNIQSQQPPAFFKGTPFFTDSPSKGRKKDDGLARLHYGEAVIPAAANKRAKGLSQALIDGKENDWIYTNHILPAIVQDRADRKANQDKSFAANIARSMTMNMTDERMYRELKRSRIVQENVLDQISKDQRKNPFRA
jgi:hypothetical protein